MDTYAIIELYRGVERVKRNKKCDKAALINLVTAIINLIVLLIRLLSEGN